MGVGLLFFGFSANLMSEAHGGFEGVSVVGSIVVGLTPPEDILESTPLHRSVMF